MPGEFGFPKYQEFGIMYCNNEQVTQIAATLTGSGSGSIQLEIGTCDTWDGTYTFQVITDISGGTTTLTTPGIFIKPRLVGQDYTLTEIRIQIVNP